MHQLLQHCKDLQDAGQRGTYHAKVTARPQYAPAGIFRQYQLNVTVGDQVSAMLSDGYRKLPVNDAVISDIQQVLDSIVLS